MFENEQNHFNNNSLSDFENRQTLHKPLEPPCPVRRIEQSSTLSNLDKFPISGPNIEDSLSHSTHMRKLITTNEQGKVELKPL